MMMMDDDSIDLCFSLSHFPSESERKVRRKRSAIRSYHIAALLYMHNVFYRKGKEATI